MRPDEPAARIRLTGTPPAAALGVVAVLALSSALRFPWLAAERFWFDEVFSVVVASQELGTMLRMVVADETNPPGFYLLLGAWVRLGGYGEAWVRALPAIAGAFVPPALVLAARAGGVAWRPALLAGAFAAASPILIAKSVEVRAYAPLALVATVALGLVLAIARADRVPVRRYVMLGALDVLLVALHYFGALTVTALMVAGSIAARSDRRRRARPLALAAAPALALLTAWLVFVARLTNGSGLGGNAAWIADPTLATSPAFATQFLGAFDSTLLAWVVVAVLLRVIVWGALEARDRTARALVAAATVPLLLALGIGWALGQPIWVGRYLIAIGSPLLLLLALALERAAGLGHDGRATGDARDAREARLAHHARLAIPVLAVGWASLAGWHAIAAAPRKADWPAIISELTRHGPATACVNENYVGLPFQYYAARDRAPMEVTMMRDCARSDRQAWAIYRPGTEASLLELEANGARLGAPFSLVTEMPETWARRVEWRPALISPDARR